MEKTVREFGRVIRVPASGPGVVFAAGQERPFVVEGMWLSPVAPALDQSVEVELDAAGMVATVQVIQPLSPSVRVVGGDRQPAAVSRKAFLSYRRQDSSGYAGRLSDHITRHLGTGSVFRDIEAIEAGADFIVAIEDAVGSCRAFILLMGPRWLTAVDAGGRRRLDDPHDFVRLEIVTALAAGVRIIPALVEGAQMPKPEELPPDIAAITRIHAIDLTDARFEYDVERLIRVLRTAIGESPREVVSPASVMKAPVLPTESARPRAPGNIKKSVVPTKPIPIRLMRSYFSALLCFPLGIAAIGASNKCAAALSSGDTATAQIASDAARKWNGLALPCSFPYWIGIFILLSHC